MKITTRGVCSVRRPTISSRYRVQRKTQQRRYKASSAPENGSGSSSSEEAVKSHGTAKADATASPAGPVASSAGASPAPLATQPARRSFGQMVRASALGRLGDAYSRAQQRRPYVTQLCSSLVVYLIGDLSAQFMFPSDDKKGGAKEETKSDAGASEEEQKAEGGSGGGYDPLRTLRHLTVGAISSIPSYKWFMFLHHNFNYASKFLSITTKVAVQQACFTPVFNTYFFSMQSLLAGASLDETWERLKKAVPTSIKNSVKLWPAVTAFSFMYIPPHFRSVFGGTIAVGWQTYLSWLNQKAAREVEAAEAADRIHAQTGGLTSAEISPSQVAMKT
ncbi:hypothetical protein DTO280E4_8864 [Paecilomyces variotii]|nr:hypothetical protein DTO169C6_7874 [Paecilomyces variotii]KAJ9349808.1 hypothetical protein DTO280E4_8864 [Paecilomyces variotii]